MSSGFDTGFDAGWGGPELGILNAELTKIEGTYDVYKGTTQTLTYFAIGDDQDQNIQSILDGMVALGTPAFPTPFSVLTGDTSSKAQVWDVEQLRNADGTGGSGDAYIIRVTFSPIRPGQPTVHNNNPLLWNTPLRMTRVPKLRKVTHGRNQQQLGPPDAGGDAYRPVNTYGPIINAAGDRVDVEHEIEVTRRVLVATKNYVDIDAVQAVADVFENTYNSSTFYGRPAGFARFLSIEEQDAQEYKGVAYVPAVLKIALDSDEDREGFVTIQNVGRYRTFYDPNRVPGKVSKAPVTYEGLPTTEPQQLKISGEQASMAEIHGYFQGQTYFPPISQTLDYDYLSAANYTTLGIGS